MKLGRRQAAMEEADLGSLDGAVDLAMGTQCCDEGAIPGLAARASVQS